MFPTPTATAFTIRALHAGRTGAEAARKKSIGLASSFAGAFMLKVAAGYLPGIIWDWHIGWTFYRLGWTNMIQLDNYGWWLECMSLVTVFIGSGLVLTPLVLVVTPAFFGSGMLSGMNASWSFFGGFVLAWGIIAPSIIHTGVAVGRQRAPKEFPEVYSYLGMSYKTPEAYIHAPSPRYWLLWPGVLIMLVYSVSELIMSFSEDFKNLSIIPSNIAARIRRLRAREDPNVIHNEDGDDPAPVSTCFGILSGCLIGIQPISSLL